jgi:methyl coenzyme M reductase subunit C
MTIISKNLLFSVFLVVVFAACTISLYNISMLKYDILNLQEQIQKYNNNIMSSVSGPAIFSSSTPMTFEDIQNVNVLTQHVDSVCNKALLKSKITEGEGDKEDKVISQ